MTTTEFKNSLKSLSTKEVLDKIEYYSGFEPRGINYQTMLDLYKAEIERRIYNWEMVNV
jgi:hypothetical protein